MDLFYFNDTEKHKEENRNLFNFPSLRINNYINTLAYLLAHFLKENFLYLLCKTDTWSF